MTTQAAAALVACPFQSSCRTPRASCGCHAAMGGLPAPGHKVPVIPGPAPGYPLIPGPRVPLLDPLRTTKSIYSEFYDPDGAVYGLPTYPYRWAPAIYATRRQLSDRGLRPGGQQPCAQILWRHRGRRRVGYLYLVVLALPKRPMTPTKWGALAAALIARSTCPLCGQVKQYCIPVSIGHCNDCDAGSEP